ncbi:MAG: hypothetical protein NVS9B15_19690 [Acidobacteriaceae bacterium]
MKHQVVRGMGVPREVTDVVVVAFYEPSTGKVVQMHTSVSFKGAPAVTEEQAIARARRQAEHARLETSHLAVKVSKRHEHALRPHRIDVNSGEFVLIEREEGRAI